MLKRTEDSLIGDFCNCWFQDADYVNLKSSMHQTEVEKDGTCCWCGYYTVSSIKPQNFKFVNIDELTFSKR